jgi:hypothetical protein
MIVALVIAMVKKHLVTIVNEINVVNNTGWWSSEKTSYIYIYIYKLDFLWVATLGLGLKRRFCN